MSSSDPPATAAPKRRRFGVQTAESSGSFAPLTEDTPRGLIRGLAAASEGSGGPQSSAGQLSATPRGLIRAFQDAAQTGTISTAETNDGIDMVGSGGRVSTGSGQRRALVALPRSTGADALTGLPPLPPKTRLERVGVRPPPASAGRKKIETLPLPREFPQKTIKVAAMRFAEQLPKPNMFTADALEALQLSATEFFTIFADDYKHFVANTADPNAPMSLNRRDISKLMLQNGLVSESEGILNAVNRLLDREDADVALGVPLSAAEKAARMKM